MQNIPLPQQPVGDFNLDLVMLIILIVLFAIVLWRRSLAAVASLVMIATAFIVSRSAPLINEWLTYNQTGNFTGLQAMVSVRIAIVIVLSSFVLIILKRVASKVPLLIKILSAALFSGLLFWYVIQGLQSGHMLMSVQDTRVYFTLERVYPIGLLATLILATLELWFVYRASAKPKTKK